MGQGTWASSASCFTISLTSTFEFQDVAKAGISMCFVVPFSGFVVICISSVLFSTSTSGHDALNNSYICVLFCNRPPIGMDSL